MNVVAERVATPELQLETEPVRTLATVDQLQAMQPRTLPASPVEMVADLLRAGVSPAQLEAFLAVQQKYEAEQARRAFDAAMAAFKGEDIAQIVKKKRVSFATKDGSGQVDYKHETLDQVVDACRVPMSKHGLSASWTVDQRSMKPMIVVTCVVTHALGHSKSVELFGPPDDSGKKNPLQQVRSAISFLQRATLLLAVGLAARGEDNDGRGTLKPNQAPADEPERNQPRSKGGDGKMTEGMKKNIAAKLKAANVHEDALLVHFKVATIDDLKFDDMTAVQAWIKERKANGG